MHSIPDVRTLLTEATDLLAGELCIWCESRPKAASSHLCSGCRQDDPDGLLHRAVRPDVVRSSV